jgi:hypothetical protein
MINWEVFTALAKSSELTIIQTTATQYFSVAGMFEQVAEEIARRARELPSMDFVANIAIQLPGDEKRSCC